MSPVCSFTISSFRRGTSCCAGVGISSSGPSGCFPTSSSLRYASVMGLGYCFAAHRNQGITSDWRRTLFWRSNFRVSALTWLSSALVKATLDFFSSSVIGVTTPCSSTRAWAPRNRHLSPRRHSPASSKLGQVVVKSRDDWTAGLLIVSVTTKGGVYVMQLADGSLISLGLEVRYAGMSCVNRHLDARQRRI